MLIEPSVLSEELYAQCEHIWYHVLEGAGRSIPMTGSASRKRDNNLNIRVTPQQKQIIMRAAQIKQTTVSNFVLARALEAAQEMVLEQCHFTLSANQWKEFCHAFEAAPREYKQPRKLLIEPSAFDRSS